MASVRIPPSQRESLVLVATMSADSFEALESCFGPVEGDLSTVQVEQEIASAIPAVEEAGPILDALIGACAYGRGRDLTPEDAGKKIAESDVLELDDQARSALADRLASVFQSPVLEPLAHAASLLAEDEYSYCTSRILSDLRPMFGADEDVTPSSALLRHTLKFDVHIDGRLKSVVISIDNKALEELAAGVERAQKKAESLRDLAHRAGLRVIELKETH